VTSIFLWIEEDILAPITQSDIFLFVKEDIMKYGPACYWSLDSNGNVPISPQDLGLPDPSLCFRFQGSSIPDVYYKDAYTCLESLGFDPKTQQFAKEHDYPLAELYSKITFLEGKNWDPFGSRIEEVEGKCLHTTY